MKESNFSKQIPLIASILGMLTGEVILQLTKQDIFLVTIYVYAGAILFWDIVLYTIKYLYDYGTI